MKISILITVFISMLSGLLLYMSAVVAFTVTLTVFSFYIAVTRTDIEDRHFILSIMSLALILRFTAIIFAQYYCTMKGTLDILGDAHSNLEMGKFTADFLTGKRVIQKSLYEDLGSWNKHALIYLNGIFFALFGDNVSIALKYINSLSIVISGWLIYDLTKKIYSSIAGKVAISIVLFWPTLFVWSITGLKESHLILAIIIMFWCLNRIISEKDIKQYIIFSIPLITSASYAILLRYNLLLPLILINFIAVFVYLAFLRYIKNNHGVKKLIFIISISCVFILLNYRKEIYQIAKNYFGGMVGHHMAYLGSGGFNYNLIGDSHNYYTISFFLKYLFGAWYHFLLEPLPWHIFSLSMLVSYPTMIVWYTMLSLSIIGVIKIARIGKMKEIFPLLVFTVLYTTVVGMSVANIGTAIRFRDTIMPFIAIFASCGFVKKAILVSIYSTVCDRKTLCLP